MRTMSFANNPPQQRLCPIITPYFSHLLRISLINKLNRIVEIGQFCLTPRLIGNSSDNISKTIDRTLDIEYRLNKKSKHLPPDSFFFFFYGGLTPIIFIYLINLKKLQITL